MIGNNSTDFPELTQRRWNAGIKTPTRVELERDLEFPGPGGQLPRVGTQLEPYPYTDVRVRKSDPDRRGRPQEGHGGPEPIWSSDAALMDTVARLQLDLDEMRAESRRLRTPGGRDSPSQPRHLRQLRCRSLLV